ncbi:hypothetical protein E2562_031146 [Oryza meyeriana var. granulata]|uniref:Uncharacterized protein n=1 Tax=Oryza meyeriana var. granulata TaxID=110450 RepID=A0A6G1DPZ6_9ORYZ|nr:hypothetical protein E2562_031146 [Oryza meyeriana var. granulata]
MTPAVAAAPPRPHPTSQNPSGPQQQPPAAATATMGNPHLGLGLASDHSAAPPPPPPRRVPRLAKRRYAAASSRSRHPPTAASPAAAPWNPFGGVTDGTGQDGIGELAGGVGGGTGKGQSGFLFGSAAPATTQQSQQPPAASSDDAPFVFGSVRASLPQFEEGWSASAKLPEKIEKMNVQTPGPLLSLVQIHMLPDQLILPKQMVF